MYRKLVNSPIPLHFNIPPDPFPTSLCKSQVITMCQAPVANRGYKANKVILSVMYTTPKIRVKLWLWKHFNEGGAVAPWKGGRGRATFHGKLPRDWRQCWVRRKAQRLGGMMGNRKTWQEKNRTYEGPGIGCLDAGDKWPKHKFQLDKWS